MLTFWSKIISVVATSIRLLSPVVEVAAAPAFDAAKPEPEELAVADATVKEICWLSVTALLKVALIEKVLLELSLAASVKDEKAAVEPTVVISPTLVEPSNKARALIFEELATVNEQAVKVVATASASELPPPS